jgi:hypothetical protein
MHQKRKTDFRKGVQLGRYDHLVIWKKPARPDWMDEETYRQFPDELVMRELRIHIKAKGRKVRTRSITIASTLCNHDEYSKTDMGDLYRQRWHAEICQANCTSSVSCCRSCGSGYDSSSGVAGLGSMD